MELIIKICDPPPPYFHQKKKNHWSIMVHYFLYGELEFGCICLYRAHAERVGGRFTYNQLKWNVCKKMFLKESYYYSSSCNKTKICT